jgi:threonine dehydratase
MNLPDQAALAAVRQRIHPYIHRTPVLTSSTFDAWTGASLFFKCENFQRMGAYKMRGASHALSMLTEEERRAGVITHSSGNFAQALALAARMNGVKAIIVMPEHAPQVKVNAVRGYGAEIVFSGPSPAEREALTERLVRETGAAFIHPSNDWQVILGNSSCAAELIEDVSDLDMILAPVGGGGLLAGTALAARVYAPQAEVYAAEPEIVDDAYRSMRSGRIEGNTRTDTIADGLRTQLGDVNFPVIRECVKDVVLVSEKEIASAMFAVWERMKILIEPSSAVPVAAALRYAGLMRGKRVGIIVSGGNVDLRAMCRLLD